MSKMVVKKDKQVISRYFESSVNFLSEVFPKRYRTRKIDKFKTGDGKEMVIQMITGWKEDWLTSLE